MADTKEIIKCPACGKEMKKVFISETGFNLDICIDGCGSILFDNRELNKFDDQNENINEIVETLKNKEFEKVDTQSVRVCPICNIPMVKMGAGKGNVQIDICHTCGAKFLDYGELEIIHDSEYFDVDKFSDLLNNVYQTNLDEVLGNKQKNATFINQFFTPARDYVFQIISAILYK